MFLRVDGQETFILANHARICQRCWGTWFDLPSLYPGHVVEAVSVAIL